jgi:pimeloyl-ACP methyl ester carboxylesterase
MPTLRLDANRKIAYQQIRGDADKPVLIFLHQGLGCMAMWKQFPQALCRRLGYPGLVYDRQGYGLSSPLAEARTIHYMHAYALDELPKVIERLLPQKPFVLIGHSDGGSIALIYAAERNSCLRGVISEAAHVFVEPINLTTVRQTLEAYRNGRLEALKKYHGQQTDAVIQAWADVWSADWFKPWHIGYLLPAIKQPVLVLQGTDDAYGTLAQVDAIAAGVAGHVETAIIEACGHAPHDEYRQQVLDLMADFITQRL